MRTPRLTQDHEYIDYVLGRGPLILGHSHPALVDAVGRQLQRGQTFGAGHSGEFEVAERVCAAIPGMEQVLWSNTGSEAAQIALRLARAATGRLRYVKFGGHYHGWSDPMLIGYRPAADGSLDGTASLGQHPRSADDAVVLPWNDLNAVAEVLADPANDVAAVFAEPVLCNSGVLKPAPGFLAGLRRLCSQHGAVLVFDEVITGFRVAYGGGAERYSVTPDLVILAKAIAGGLSLSAVAGRRELTQLATRGVVHAGTYNGNPLVLAAAGATLDTLGAAGVYGTFEERGRQLAAGMAQGLAEHGVTAAIHQVGPVVQCLPGQTVVDTFEDFLGAELAWYDALTVELLARGVFALPGGRWYLSTAHSAEDVDLTTAAFADAVGATVQRVGKPVAG